MEIFSVSVIIYSYLFVGVGLAQNFKPITNFTRDFHSLTLSLSLCT